MRRITNNGTYNVEIPRLNAKYLVVLIRLKNSVYGNPRFKAILINREVKGYVSSPTYTFKGHYMDEYDEARWIVERHLEK